VALLRDAALHAGGAIRDRERVAVVDAHAVCDLCVISTRVQVKKSFTRCISHIQTTRPLHFT